tara:strand:- start:15741 stop:16166 length:426 start_codon:yes stop_codon:yes gene_type:complete
LLCDRETTSLSLCGATNAHVLGTFLDGDLQALVASICLVAVADLGLGVADLEAITFLDILYREAGEIALTGLVCVTLSTNADGVWVFACFGCWIADIARPTGATIFVFCAGRWAGVFLCAASVATRHAVGWTGRTITVRVA